MFAYIETAGIDAGNRAAMELTDLTVDQDYCLEFYYHMHGSDIGALTVGVNYYEPIFFLQGGRSCDIIVAFLSS